MPCHAIQAWRMSLPHNSGLAYVLASLFGCGMCCVAHCLVYMKCCGWLMHEQTVTESREALGRVA
eukprot:160724-Alexandrium_andersonii.AAC.1